MGLKMKNLNILGVHWKIRLLRERGEFADLRGGGLGKKEGRGVFDGGWGWVDTPNAHYVLKSFQNRGY